MADAPLAINAPAQQTKWVTEPTGKEVPIRVGACVAQAPYKDTLEKWNMHTTLDVVVSSEMRTYRARLVGTQGCGLFKREQWQPVPGTVRPSPPKVERKTRSYEHTFDGESREYAAETVAGACEAERRELLAQVARAQASRP